MSAPTRQPDVEQPGGSPVRPAVLMVHDYPPLTGGGLALSALELARLCGRDHDVLVVSSRAADHFADDRSTCTAGAHDASAPWKGQVAVVRTQQAIAAMRRADLLVAHWTFSFRRLATASLLIGTRLGKPTVCVIHTAPDHWRYNRLRLVPGVAKRLALRAFVRLALRQCRAVVALSCSHAEALRAVGVPVTHVLPIPVRAPPVDAPTAATSRERPWTIGIVGELSTLKGADDIAGVLQELTPACGFRIVGSGALAADVLRTVEALDARRRALVTVEPPIAWAEMAAFFASIDCLLVLSRTESQCRVIAEAMLCGVLVLARPTSGISDSVVDGKTGFLVDPARPLTIARCVDLLAADPRVADAVRARARDAAERATSASRRDWETFLLGLGGCRRSE